MGREEGKQRESVCQKNRVEERRKGRTKGKEHWGGTKKREVVRTEDRVAIISFSNLSVMILLAVMPREQAPAAL